MNTLLQEIALEWERRFNEAKISCAALRTVPDALRHPQLEHRDLLMTLDAPEGLAGEVAFAERFL